MIEDYQNILLHASRRDPPLGMNNELCDESHIPDANPWEDSQQRQERAPRVTVGMPVYNIEEFLGPTLESILDQTFGEFEVLISDDASTDGTGSVARSYADRYSRVHYHRNPRNLGGYLNFNLPLNWARGEYFIWAGQDDLWEPGYLERMVRLLDDDPDAVLAMTVLDHIDSHDEAFREYPRLVDLAGRNHVDELKRFIRQPDVHGKTNLFHGLIRTDILRDIGGYIPWCNRPFGEDTLLAFRVLGEGRLRVAPYCLWHKRWLPTAVGGNILPARGDTLKERLKGILIDFYDEYQYMRGYSRIVWTLDHLTTKQKLYLEAAVWRRYLQMFGRKVGRTIHAGLRRLSGLGPKEKNLTSGEETD